MAVSTKKKAVGPAKKQIVDVSAKTTDEEILALEERNFQLRFDEKDFRDLPESVIEKLSNANARDYFIAKGAASALAKNATRAEAGFSGLEIVDPLRGKPKNKLQVKGKEKGWHYCWKRPDEVEECKELGYKMAPESVKTPGATRASSSHVITAKDGKDDLVLMMVPEKIFEQHLQANALLSKKRAGATVREVAGMVAKANKHLESVADLPYTKETTTVEEVPIVQDMARR